MKRNEFLQSITLLPFLENQMNLQELKNISNTLASSEEMPLLFVGHGSPMNAIATNSFTKNWQKLGKNLPKPQAILSISAHWLTFGQTKVATALHPETIHDFGGFPQELFDVQYPSLGSPDLAKFTKELVQQPEVMVDNVYGLDHGTWSVLKPMYPLADIPVFQLSIDYRQKTSFHYELGKQLKELRKKGVLIMGSGNLVHNLGALRFTNPSTPFDWAEEFDTTITQWLIEKNDKSIVNFQQLGKLAQIAHPSYDHFLPLLFLLGLVNQTDQLRFFNTQFDMGSISMRSMIWGKENYGM
jgi:4,5-DOPA dioxygenase extradiol